MSYQKSKQTEHKHKLKRVYARDGILPGTDIQGNPSTHPRSGQVRYLLLWKCETCPYKQAYEMTTERPGSK